MDRVSLFLLEFVTESYCRESDLKSFVLKLITGRVCLIKTERSLRLGNTLPEQWRNVTSRAHSGTTMGATFQESLGSVQELKGWKDTLSTQGGRAMGQASGEPCSGAGRLVRRSVAQVQSRALPGKNGCH